MTIVLYDNAMIVPPSDIPLGPISIKIYSVIIFLAVLAGYYLAKKRASLYGLSQELMDKLLPYLVIGGIIGARLYHVLDEWSYYRDHLLEIFMLWQGGIGIYGCIVGGIVATWFFAKRYDVRLLKILDLIAPSVLLGQAIGRWGNYFNQEAYGPPTSVPWKIAIDEANRLPMWRNYEYFHPLFLYESLLNFLGVLLLLFLAKRHNKFEGRTFAQYLIIYGFIRLVLEFFRYDTAVLLNVRVAVIISVGFVVLGLFFLRFSKVNH